MREKHLDLLSELGGGFVLVRLSDSTRDFTGVFVFLAGNGSEVCLRAALGFGWAGLTGQFQRTILGDALAGPATGRIGIVSPELLERLALWADVLISSS